MPEDERREGISRSTVVKAQLGFLLAGVCVVISLTWSASGAAHRTLAEMEESKGLSLQAAQASRANREAIDALRSEIAAERAVRFDMTIWVERFRELNEGSVRVPPFGR